MVFAFYIFFLPYYSVYIFLMATSYFGYNVFVCMFVSIINVCVYNQFPIALQFKWIFLV